MIPKRAIFYWEGDGMSWLRSQSLETFQLLNPTWEIVLIAGKGVPIEGDSVLDRVLRSDWARYRELYNAGGLYLDTDIVFCKPIPDAWLESDLILPMGESRVIDHVAVLGSKPQDPFFEMVGKGCEAALRADGIHNYQYFGVQLINRMSASLSGRKIRWIQPDAYIPIPWDKTEKLWEDDLYLSPLTMGVHWFGGDKLSSAMEPKCSEAWAMKSGSMVAKAIRAAWSYVGEQEAHREQHGVL